MLKSIAYLLLFLLGIGATFSSSLWGGVSVILAYLLNPIVVSRELPLQRFQFYTAIAFILSTMMYPKSRLQSIWHDRMVFRSLGCYAVVCMLTSLWATDMLWSFEHAFDFNKTLLIAWLLTTIVHDERGIRILLFASLIGSLHAAFMHTLGVDLDWVSKKFADEYGTLPDMQAPVMLLLLPLFLLIAIFGRNGYQKLLGWVGLPIVLNSIVESYQRAYFVGLLAECLFLLLFLPKKIALRLTPVLTMAVILYVTVLTPANYWSWMDTINRPAQEGSASSRFDLYKASAEMLRDHPMGVGYRCYIFESHNYLPASYFDEEHPNKAAHSTFCTVACETGVLGFAFWSVSIALALWLLRRIRKAANTANPDQIDIYAMGIELGLIGWLVGGFFHSDHQVDPAYWFLAFAVVLHRLKFAPDSENDQQIELHEDISPDEKPSQED